MKPHANSGQKADYPLTPFTAARNIAIVVPHPLSKKTDEPRTSPPDEETLSRLNAMARQYPFCIRHKGKDSGLL